MKYSVVLRYKTIISEPAEIFGNAMPVFEEYIKLGELFLNKKDYDTVAILDVCYNLFKDHDELSLAETDSAEKWSNGISLVYQTNEFRCESIINLLVRVNSDSYIDAVEKAIAMMDKDDAIIFNGGRRYSMVRLILDDASVFPDSFEDV